MKNIAAFLLSLCLFISIAMPAFAQDDKSLYICPKATEGGHQNFNVLCDLNLSNALPGILTFIMVIAVVIALVYLIWGGIKWITSGGDKGNVETARNQIIAAIIGLILVFLSWFIINLILSLFFGAGVNGTGFLQLPTINGDAAGGGGTNSEDNRNQAECTGLNEKACKKNFACSWKQSGRGRCVLQ